MRLKRGHYLGPLIVIIEGIVLYYISYRYYPHIIGITNVFLTVMMVELITLLYLLVKEPGKGIFVFHATRLILFPAFFAVALPEYSYEEAKQRVVAQNNEVVNVIQPSDRHEKTVPVNNHVSWFLNDRFYYFVVTMKDHQKEYISVNPINGQLVKLDKPYWGKH
ncbi:hypothetical protein [Tuberibacillus sp. Marseille-P3662]|uniref:hypothetical protein n=1 Tax=Tuberibacillus sp. Marseille-P3662 TaxID=1965358 RepID=UPI000A1C82AC|nr:hypothetical protein [Tuberibacillus sp. Marseille-P3662]